MAMIGFTERSSFL